MIFFPPPQFLFKHVSGAASWRRGYSISIPAISWPTATAGSNCWAWLQISHLGSCWVDQHLQYVQLE